MKCLTACLIVVALAPPAWAHEGEDHSAPAAPAPSVEAGSRTEAQTDALELVAVLADGQLTLYLDDFATTEPVAGAQVEVESGIFRAVATQAAPGLYTVPAGPFGPPGRYPLVVSVQVSDVADLLTATLEVAEPAAVAEQPRCWASPWDVRILAGGAGVLLLAGVGVLAARRRQRRTRTEAGRAGGHAHA